MSAIARADAPREQNTIAWEPPATVYSTEYKLKGSIIHYSLTHVGTGTYNS
jgi:hypothetical protein